MEMDQVYTELILEHNQDKRNKRLLEVFTASEHGHNPSCGDDLTLQVNVVDGIVKDAAYTGSGCAISQASASMMIDVITGKSLEEAGAIKNSQIAEELELPPVKVHCSILAEDAIKAAIADYKSKKGE